MVDRFDGKGVVVTGAAGIYGRWIAAAFARAGAKLCLTDRDQPTVEALLQTLGAAEGSLAIAADLTQGPSIDHLVSGIAAAWGAPDVLVNNAGVYPSGFLLDIDAAEWDRIMDLNLRAPFLLTQGIAKLMVGAKRPGAIVNISSGASRKMRRSVVPLLPVQDRAGPPDQGLRAGTGGIRHPGERRRTRVCRRQRSQPADRRTRCRHPGRHPTRSRLRRGGRGQCRAVPLLRAGVLRHRQHLGGGRGQLYRLPRRPPGQEGRALTYSAFRKSLSLATAVGLSVLSSAANSAASRSIAAS